MSQDKVNEYKKDKAVRKQTIAKQKRNRSIIITVVSIAALALSIFGGYHFGHVAGYQKGYDEAIALAEMFYEQGDDTVYVDEDGNEVTFDEDTTEEEE